MKFVIQLLKFVYTVYALSMFVVIMLVAFPFVLLCLPFGTIRGGNYIYKICAIWGHIWYTTIGIWHQNIYETNYDATQQYVFVANHISYMDIPPAVMAVKQPCRVLGKYEMVKYPIFGQIYKAAVILVDRSSNAQKAQSVRALKAALSYGISIFIFPEGTFNETNKPLKSFYDGAFRIAIETQTPIHPLLFIDTVDRLHFSSIFSANPGPSRVVFLPPVSVEGFSLKDVAALKTLVYNQMEAGLQRYRKYPATTV